MSHPGNARSSQDPSPLLHRRQVQTPRLVSNSVQLIEQGLILG